MRQFAIFSWLGFPIPMEEGCKLIKAAGFDGVLLWRSSDHTGVDVELSRQNGLFIENLHTPFEGINCLWDNNAAGADMEKTLADCIADCSEYAIPTVIVHLSQGDNPPPPNQTGLDRLKRLVDIAERKKINIALENLRKPEYLDFIFRNIESDRLGFCYDSGHENCYTPGMDFLGLYGSKLMALHLHDNDGSDDQHKIPGEGSIDWNIINKKLKETGYDGAIALEVIGEPSQGDGYEAVERFLERALAAAKKCLPEDIH